MLDGDDRVTGSSNVGRDLLAFNRENQQHGDGQQLPSTLAEQARLQNPVEGETPSILATPSGPKGAKQAQKAAKRAAKLAKQLRKAGRQALPNPSPASLPAGQHGAAALSGPLPPWEQTATAVEFGVPEFEAEEEREAEPAAEVVEPEPELSEVPEPGPVDEAPKPEPEPEPEPVAIEPEPVAEAFEPELEPVAEASEPEPEPVAAEPEPEPEPAAEVVEPELAEVPEPGPVDEAPEPEPEPEPEPVADVPEPEPEPEPEPVAEVVEPEPEPEPVDEAPEPEPEPVAAEPEPVVATTEQRQPLPTPQDLHDWEPLVKDLHERRSRAAAMGGPEAVARQRSMGKLPVRERLELLLDKGTFIEFGELADSMDPELQSSKGYLAADGMVAGVGEIDGRRVAVCAYDFTVLAGSMGAISERKTARMRELALRQRIPMVWLLDSAGARIQTSSGSTFAAMGDLFREQVAMSGVVPMVAAVMGHCAAGTAYIPALADFVPMVKGTSSMALGGRHLVKAATGEDVTEEDMGGSAVHNTVSGVADMEAKDDAHCLWAVRQYLSFFPSHNQEPPPRREVMDPVDRRCEELYEIVPTAPRRAYDMEKVIKVIADNGNFFPMKPGWARNVITGFCRIGGMPVGVLASQPKVLGGTLDVNSADKAARFVWLCDAFGLPLVFLQDVPGFTVGSAVERQGIIRHGAKMLFAVSEATVPKVTVVMRKAYGAGYFVMNGAAFESDYIAVWPTAEIAVMGPDGMVNIIGRRQLEKLPEGPERDAARIAMAEDLRANIDPYIAAGHAQVDDVVDPAETRAAIWRGLHVAQTKHADRPWRKHGVYPV